jgi:CheY-like chemotaxis protein
MKKILIVDDEIDFCYVVKKNLEVIGPYQVSVCSDSTQAFGIAQKERPDVILLDVMMPGVSGPHLAQQFQGESGLKSIPIIFLTGIGVGSAEGKKLRDGTVRHFVEKPVKMRTLAEMIDTILDGKEVKK